MKNEAKGDSPCIFTVETSAGLRWHRGVNHPFYITGQARERFFGGKCWGSLAKQIQGMKSAGRHCALMSTVKFDVGGKGKENVSV